MRRTLPHRYYRHCPRPPPRASGPSVSDEVLDVVRAKIFRPGTHPNRAMREVWSERRGWFFPTKEELFRQQCVVSDSLKRSNRAMTLELERALDALRRRDEHVDVLDESHLHAGHAGAAGGGGHFRALVVSDRFEGQSRVARQRLVYAALAEEMGAEIHALAMQTLTPAEWKAQGSRFR